MQTILAVIGLMQKRELLKKRQKRNKEKLKKRQKEPEEKLLSVVQIAFGLWMVCVAVLNTMFLTMWRVMTITVITALILGGKTTYKVLV